VIKILLGSVATQTVLGGLTVGLYVSEGNNMKAYKSLKLSVREPTVVIKILLGSVVTQTLLGGLTVGLYVSEANNMKAHKC